jgi:pilus assembly protein Flp/PilA
MSKCFKRLMVEQDGATMVEYALMVALIGAALVTVVGTLSSAIGGKFTSVSGSVSTAGAAS